MDYRGVTGGTKLFQPRPQRLARTQEIVMAKVIEFYVPTNIRTPLKGKLRRRGKIIEFCAQTKKSA
jgi:hypothetical protein